MKTIIIFLIIGHLIADFAIAEKSTPPVKKTAPSSVFKLIKIPTATPAVAKSIIFTTYEEGDALTLKTLDEIKQFCAKKGLELNGPMFGIEVIPEKEPGVVPAGKKLIRLAYPVKKALPAAEGDFYPFQGPSGLVVKGEYTGPYSGLEQFATKLGEFAGISGLNADGNAFEFYLNDPRTTPENLLKTVFYLPVIKEKVVEDEAPKAADDLKSKAPAHAPSLPKPVQSPK